MRVPERPGPVRLPLCSRRPDAVEVRLRHDDGLVHREDLQEDREGSYQLDLEGVVVHNPDPANARRPPLEVLAPTDDLEQVAAGHASPLHARLQAPLQGEGGVSGRQARAVVKEDPFAKIEPVAEAVGRDRPGVGQAGHETERGVEGEQPLVDLAEDDGLVDLVDRARVERPGRFADDAQDPTGCRRPDYRARRPGLPAAANEEDRCRHGD
jgi:hypothetical protein